MPRKRPQKQPKVDPVEENRRAIRDAWIALRSGPFQSLLALTHLEVCETAVGAPAWGSVDAETGTLHLNPHDTRHSSPERWATVIAHLLLHLGFNHAARREDRDPWLWNVACEQSTNGLLRSLFRMGGDEAEIRNPEREEKIYARLVAEAETDPNRYRRHYTLAGNGRPDVLKLECWHPWRADYEKALGEGIRRAMERTIAQVTEEFEGDVCRATWSPGDRARRWVINELPLLGALATQIKMIANAQICERMDISIAAVNGYLGEVYFNPAWDLTHEEWVFIYAHELLHVALLHHTRTAGRDPLVWNYACDFVINGWLLEMGVGKIPSIGALYDPRLQGMSSEEVYDLLLSDRRRCRSLRGFRGKLGDVLLDAPGQRVFRGDVTTLDDMYRRCLSAGLLLQGRGTVPAGLIEEIQALFSPPPPWDVALGRWMDEHVPFVREALRSFGRASRRQASTPDIPRAARYVPQEWLDACTFGVVLDTSGSMDRELLGRALGAICSFSESRDVPRVRLIQCDAAPYDQGWLAPTDLRGIFPVKGRGGTSLQPGVAHLLGRADFPASAPIMIITDGWCEEEIQVPREHCFVLPRKGWKEGAIPLRTSAPVFRILREDCRE
jgi:predicted metal-dependent peptidase